MALKPVSKSSQITVKYAVHSTDIDKIRIKFAPKSVEINTEPCDATTAIGSDRKYKKKKTIHTQIERTGA